MKNDKQAVPTGMNNGVGKLGHGEKLKNGQTGNAAEGTLTAPRSYAA